MTTTYPCGAQLVTVKGHTWPRGAPANPSLGVTTGEYDATATILALVQLTLATPLRVTTCGLASSIGTSGQRQETTDSPKSGNGSTFSRRA